MAHSESEAIINCKDWLRKHWWRTVLAISILGSALGGGAALVEKTKQDFRQKFSHEPQVGLSLTEGVLTLGFTTDSSQMKKWGAGPYHCGRTETIVQKLDANRHFTRQVEWAGITIAAGPGCKDWEWYEGPDNYDLLPPTK
ncbi:hypothetical protein A2397_01845 [Candidatus Amesbacteria bacterium RIFOXYB1_FULL_44_23]|uniref:Uncharacterized protein n=1 Tax=Candidatus Amesbacteria bacterium RIFOXYB1_FULL_44_23 TaxID=1797263 RepID=A0A1F4ZSR3_9BACT|nr:MAG: hypothetical protein A2397_01845 [Candidatus Amesbacteria bacterium RIFOXYB1_FULL_44_23]